MKSFVVVVALSSLAACAAAPSAPPAAAAEDPAAAAVPAPFRPFLGRHRGTMRMQGAQGEQRVPMGLDVVPMAGEPLMLTWVLRYGEGERAQVRDYRLLVDDAATGRCRIDERNGIVLPARLFGDELVSIFVVPGQTVARVMEHAITSHLRMRTLALHRRQSPAVQSNQPSSCRLSLVLLLAAYVDAGDQSRAAG